MTALATLADRWPEINALLDEALALPPLSRQPWLDAQSAAPAAVRQTVAELLAAHARAETADFMGTLPKLSGGRAAGAVGTAPAAGDCIGGWRLLTPLGHGGMGLVWRAVRADGSVKREVALKLPRLAWGGAVAERLAREQAILATLAHPNIARLYDAGTDAEGRPFIAMELVDGLPIDAFCRQRGLGLRQRLELLLQVAAAVAHAHARLVVHRDLKPANILVTADAQVRLLDFGIAKLLDGDATADTALTRQAGRALTPDYASPEQIRGEPLGTASDVYSLAVVAYELLSGRKPYVLKRTSAAQLEDAIASIDPPPASQAAAEPALRKQLRGDIDAILQQALRKDPTLRTASADAFAQDIRLHLAGLPVRARPDSRWYRTRSFVRRNRLPVAAAAMAVLALLAGSGVAGWQAVVARREAARVERALEEQDAVRQLYAETLSTLANWDAAAFARSGGVMGLLQEKAVELEAQYKNRPNELLGLLQAVTSQLSFAGQHEAALQAGSKHIDLLKRTGADTRAVVLAHLTQGRTLHHLGRFDDSEAVRRAGMAWRPDDRDAGVERARVVLAGDLGGLLSRQGKRAEAEQVLLRAEAVAVRDFAVDRDRFSLVHRLGQHHLGFDDARALRYTAQAHAGYTAHGQAESSDMADSLGNLGAALLANGRPAEAANALRQALQRNQDLFGAVDRDTVRAVGRLAAALARQGQHDEARTLLAERRALLQQSDAGDAAAGLVAVRGRLLENEMLWGDLQAAAAFIGPADAAALANPAVRDAVVYLVQEARWLAAAGRSGEARARLAALQAALPPTLRQGPAAFALASAGVDVLASAGRHADAATEARVLAAAMQRAGATATWLYRVVTEQAACATALTGQPDEAMRWLDTGTALAALPAPSAVERAESALRRAQVLRTARRVDEARALAATALADLTVQHPQSPRLLLARRLSAD